MANPPLAGQATLSEQLTPFTASPSQRAAIEAERGPVLVLAGPGAGKTFCLIERIRYLIEHHGIEPKQICAFTFTNKAAGEISARLEKFLGPRAADIKRMIDLRPGPRIGMDGRYERGHQSHGTETGHGDPTETS